MKIFQCAASCSDSGGEDACFARGTPVAKAAITGVVSCYQTNACDSGDCVQTKCAPELSACGAEEHLPCGEHCRGMGVRLPSGGMKKSLRGNAPEVGLRQIKISD